MPKESKVILLDESCFDGKSVLYCKLKHPRSGEGTYFAFSNEQTIVHEVLRFQENYRCWFNDNDVNKDGSILITTPVDPVFLILPYFEANSKAGRYMLLEQIVHDQLYPHCELLLKCVSGEVLRKAFGTKDVCDQTGYCLLPEKLTEYLSAKVRQTAEVLQNKQIQVNGCSSQISEFLKNSNAAVPDKSDYLKYACGLVCEYLSPATAQLLKQHFGITDSPKKRVAEQEVNVMTTSKKVKIEVTMTPTEDYSKASEKSKTTSKVLKATNAQKQLSKVDKSAMKSINSFFKAK